MLYFFKLVSAQKHIVWSLAKSDFRSRYLGSAFGGLWAFILPLVNLSIMWFAFQQGLKTSPKEGVPFILWLVTGMFPWTFFSDSVLSASNSIIEKSFLVKKMVFHVELLPLIKVFAALIPFLFLSLVMLLMFVGYGYWPDVFWLQIPYYALCMIALVLGICWLTSSLVVFYRDLGQVVGLVLQLGFWVTPIFWSPDHLPEQFKFITFLNPINYVISGYRSSLISKTWFWQDSLQTLYFWILILTIWFVGFYVFRRLRPHFSDVL